MTPTLLRLDTSQQPEPALLQALLRRHLRHARLTSVLLRRAGHAQHYALTQGCAGCAAERCAAGCPAALLRRALLSAGVATTLVRGLLPLPARAAALLLPARTATPLTLPPHWPELRLSAHWSAGGTPRLWALLTLDAAPQDLRAALTEQGWRCLPLPAPLAAALAQRQPTLALLPGAAWHSAPWLAADRTGEAGADAESGLREDRRLAPASPTPATPPAPECADPTAARLIERLSGAYEPLASALGQPAAATGTSPIFLPDLAPQLVAAPELTTGKQQTQIGVTPERLRRALRLSRADAQRLLDALDAAGVLGPPLSPAEPLRHPRRLLTLDAAELAARLAEVADAAI